MRVLIHSNAPWVPSGYGVQCGHLARVLRTLGHEVAVSSITGLGGGPMEWDGFPVFPSGRIEFGLDTLPGHARLYRADLIITLMDFYRLYPIAEQLREFNIAAWLPVDTAELGRPDAETLKRSGARPIAMSAHGYGALWRAGWREVLTAPHMHDVDQAMYEQAAADRARYREGMGIADRFVVGICAANNDQFRKGFPEQFEAFRRFRRTCPEAYLMVHTLAKGGVDLEQLARDLDLEGNVRFTDHYAQVAGAMDDSMMRDWYSVLDVFSNCSFGEGFGVPLLEAQALGTPGIATRCSAMADQDRAEWLVEGEPFWNYVHQAWWKKPNVEGIVRALGKARRYASTRREKVREIAAPFHQVEQLPVWEKILGELEPRG